MRTGVAAGVAALSLFDIAIAETAVAQDTAPADLWTGWYAGGHGGYRWGEAEFSSAPYTTVLPMGGGAVTFPGRNDSFHPDSGIAGLHGGHNLPAGANWVLGAEGDFTWGWGEDAVNLMGNLTSISGDAFAYTIRSEVEFNWQATLRGRLGYASGDWLVYGTAGVAFLDVEWNETMTVTRAFAGSATYRHSKDDIQVGLAIGGGLEKMLNDRWSVRGEYLYENFGSINVPHGATSPPQIGKLDDIEAHKVRFGITRKIGGP